MREGRRSAGGRGIVTATYRELILGSGISFPFSFARKSGSTEVSTVTSITVDRINQSIWQILGTDLGERVMRPDFGSALRRVLFMPLDMKTRVLICTFVMDALKRWEKRIKITDAKFLADWSTLEGLEWVDRNAEMISIEYTVIQNQVAGNCVFPFYTDTDLKVMGYGYYRPAKVV